MNTANGPIAICRQQIVPLHDLAIPVGDLGFIHGTTVSEQVRSFNGRPFLLRQHYQRWLDGLQTLGITCPISFDELELATIQLLQHNSCLLKPDAEQGICFFTSPGTTNLGWENSLATEPKASIYTYPLPIEAHRAQYRQGISLRSTTIAEVPVECWPRNIKVRSRLHYYLAQRQAHQALENAYPIVLDQSGHVSDSAIASIVAFREAEGLIVRPADQRYCSISVQYVVDLAKQIGLAVSEREISLDELKSCNEVFLASTPWCLLPVKHVDAVELSPDATIYPVWRKLMDQWQRNVNCDFCGSYD